MITSSIPTSFKQEVLDGIHDATDTYMIALFTSDAVLDARTKSYSGQAGEVPNGNNNGYSKGGKELSGRKSGVSGTTAFLTFDDPHWANATFTARGALIYNASKGNRAVGILNFGQDHTCTNGSFVVTMPREGAHAIVALG